LLAANTAQTGHDINARNRLWRLPLALLKDDRTHRGFINLEPWYEGIKDQFWAADQIIKAAFAACRRWPTSIVR
jgi:hypothetical protein